MRHNIEISSEIDEGFRITTELPLKMFVFDRRYAVSGAQSPEILLRAMDQVLAQSSEESAVFERQIHYRVPVVEDEIVKGTLVARDGEIAPWQGKTDIFIRPGFDFQATDALMTNFHLPKSTLMMLVSALMGRDRMMQVYAHAIDARYRFFSYGDASLLLPGG